MPKLDVASGELVSASKTVGRDAPSAPQPVPATVEYAYQYDDIGNRISSTEQSPGGSQLVATAYTANSLNQYTSISASDFGLQTSDFAPQFDDDGNQTLVKTATGVWQVTYNGENRPILWELANSSTPNSSTQQLYIPYYDNNGNIMGYWDEQGNVVAEYTYDAFGNIIDQSGTMADVFSFRFSTKYFDPETGLYYYGYRYYSPILMRWLTRDPIGEAGGVNLYAMCGNNAVAQIDSLGEAVKS